MGIDYYPCKKCSIMGGDDVLDRCYECQDFYCGEWCSGAKIINDHYTCKNCLPKCSHCDNPIENLVLCTNCDNKYDLKCFNEFFDLGGIHSDDDDYTNHEWKGILKFTVSECFWCIRKCSYGDINDYSYDIICERCLEERSKCIEGVEVFCKCGYQYLCKPCIDYHNCDNIYKDMLIKKFI